MATSSQERTEQRFDVGSGSELSVSNVSGRIAVKADEGSEIAVRYIKHGAGRARENTEVQIERSGKRVTVQTRSLQAGLINFGRSSPVEYEITVPRDCSARLHAVSADVTLEGPRAETGVQTVSGDVKISNVAGDITVTTVSGDLAASELSGTLVARTTSGDATVANSRLRRWSISTVSGDFTLDTPLNRDEHCTAKTVSGDLQLLVPADTGATVQLRSISGSVSCELPAEIIKSGRRHWQGRINGGGGHVEMNSVSGDLRIRRTGQPGPTDEESPEWQAAGDSTDWRPEPPEPLAANDSRPPTSGSTDDDESGDLSDVLAAVERGELSIEDALARLV